MKFEENLISCILPTYNRKKFVFDRLNELNRASYDIDLEVVIVEDGSKEEEQLDSSEIRGMYPNLRFNLIKLKENSGSVTIPRNIGIAASKGEFIAHTDDDVKNHPDKFRHLLDKLTSDIKYKIVYGDRCDLRPKYILEVKCEGWNPLVGWGVDGGQFMYRRNVYSKINPIFARRGCDWETAKAICQEFGLESLGYIPNAVSTYIWHDQNRSLNENTKHTKIYPGKYRKLFDHTMFQGKIPDEV